MTDSTFCHHNRLKTKYNVEKKCRLFHKNITFAEVYADFQGPNIFVKPHCK